TQQDHFTDGPGVAVNEPCCDRSDHWRQHHRAAQRVARRRWLPAERGRDDCREQSRRGRRRLMLNNLQSQWPILVFALMFFVLPMATIPGMFDAIFIVLGGFTFVILALVVGSLVSSRSKPAHGE